MRVTTLILQNLIRLLWVVNILLGIAFWLGHLVSFEPLHQTFGFLIAIFLIVLSILAIVRAGAFGLGGAGIVVAILLPIVGMGQLDWLPGSGHFVIQILHLLVGIAAIAVAEAIGGQIRRSMRGAAGAGA
ncbi:MAG: hypothetical protein WAM30_21555 [Candidatus Dormiibacterota bacterium]